MNPFVHEFSVDLRNGKAVERARKELSQGDAYADKLVVHVQDSGVDVDLDGVGVIAKVIRYDGRTVPLTGTVEDGAACIVLDADCYTIPGEIRVTMCLTAGDMVQTVLVLLLNVTTSETEIVVDNGVIGDLTSILGAIAEMREATEDAKAVSTGYDAKVAEQDEKIDAIASLRGISVTDWEQGVIASATGANGTSTTRCRSGYHRVLAGAEVRVAANGQQYIVYTYDSDQGYIGRTSDGWVTEDTAIVVDWDGYIRLCVAYTDSATITPDEVTVAVDLIPVIVSEFEKIHDAFTSSPTAIVCEAAGDVAVTTDAAERQAQSLVSIITAVQEGEGDPTPDNVRPIVGWDAVQLWHGAAYDAAAEATLSADLPEIVYGGTLDWATGLLTITHFVQTLDGTETWASTTAGVYSHSSGSLYAKTASTNQVAYHVCSHFKADRYRSSGNADNSCYETNNNKLNIKCTSITTLADWTAYLAAQAAAGTPVTIVWEYIPKYYTTIQLDSQALTLLKGSNALWSDTGDTSVVYIADTKMYIDNAIAAIAASIINQ